MRLALGTVQFGVPYGIANRGGQVDEATAAAIVGYARDSGVDTIDTAIGYGDSETVLGRVGVNGLRVITKLPPLPAEAADASGWVADQVHASLGRLKIECLSGVLLHRPDQLLTEQGGALAAALIALKQRGLVEKIGVSVYGTEELGRLRAVCPIDLLQAPLNLIDRRLARDGTIDSLKRDGVEVHVRSAYLQGLLLMPPEARPPRFARWPGLWQRWDGWLAQHPEISPAAACIGFVQRVTSVDRVVVGVDCLEQMRALVAAASQPVPSDFPDLACDDEDLINPALWSKP